MVTLHLLHDPNIAYPLNGLEGRSKATSELGPGSRSRLGLVNYKLMCEIQNIDD